MSISRAKGLYVHYEMEDVTNSGSVVPYGATLKPSSEWIKVVGRRTYGLE
jgi:hypothetical protein